jgi:hypothetical protein
MSLEPILVVKRTRQAPDAWRRLVGKAGRRDGLFARDTRDRYLICGAVEVCAEGGVYRVVFTLWPAPTLDRALLAPPPPSLGKPKTLEPYEDAIHWRGLLGDDWERTTPQEEDRRRLQRRLREGCAAGKP